MIIIHKEITVDNIALKRLEKIGTFSEFLFFDIETTGFNRIKDHLISITFMYYDDGKWQITQLFSESENDEYELLINGKTYFDTKDIHITYNGNNFDVPFLNTKYNYYTISASLNKSKSYDLYRIARKSLTLDSYKLKAIEKDLGINRFDEISGLQCIDYYRQYLLTKNSEYASLILQHNYEDVLNLLELTQIIDQLSELQLNQIRISPFQYSNYKLYLNNLLLKDDFLEISIWSYISNSKPYQCSSLNTMNHYYPNGGYLAISKGFRSPTNSLEEEWLINLKLPIYTKIIGEQRLCLLDYQSFSIQEINLLYDSTAFPILQYNEFWLYEHISKIVILLLENTQNNTL